MLFLEKYFLQKNEVLVDILKHYSDKKVSIWGAGRKCLALLKSLGENANKIDYVYDINPAKHNTILLTGHRVVDYKKTFSDVILLSSGSFEIDVYHRVKVWKNFPKIINIDHIVSGNLKTSDIIANDKELVKVRDVRLCALVILYNPENDSNENIESYINDVDYLYIFDNSDKTNEDLYGDILERNKDKIRYIWNNGDNIGLAKPINIVAKAAIEKGYEWLITFDQDSFADIEMLKGMKKYLNSDRIDPEVAIVTPTRINKPGTIIEENVPIISFVNDTIQSGAIHNLKILKELGGYDENIFIDFLDLEYCARCIANGYKIAKVNKATLQHGILDTSGIEKNILGKSYKLGKYSPVRYYYRHRNAKYCFNKYKEISPYFADVCNEFFKEEKILLENDVNKEVNSRAIQIADADFKIGKMGKKYSDIL